MINKSFVLDEANIIWMSNSDESKLKTEKIKKCDNGCKIIQTIGNNFNNADYAIFCDCLEIRLNNYHFTDYNHFISRCISPLSAYCNSELSDYTIDGCHLKISNGIFGYFDDKMIINQDRSRMQCHLCPLWVLNLSKNSLEEINIIDFIAKINSSSIYQDYIKFLKLCETRNLDTIHKINFFFSKLSKNSSEESSKNKKCKDYDYKKLILDKEEYKKQSSAYNFVGCVQSSRISLLASTLKAIILSKNEFSCFTSFLKDCNHVEFFSLQEIIICENKINNLYDKSDCGDVLENKSYNQTDAVVNNESGLFLTIAPNLEVINLNKNCIDSIRGLKKIINNHPKIQFLGLSCNGITEFQEDLIPYLPNLQILSCLDNKLFSSESHGSRDDNGEGLRDDKNYLPLQTLPSNSLSHQLISYRLFLMTLRKFFPNLMELYLLGNPFLNLMNINDYRSLSKTVFANLRWLDDYSY